MREERVEKKQVKKQAWNDTLNWHMFCWLRLFSFNCIRKLDRYFHSEWMNEFNSPSKLNITQEKEKVFNLFLLLPSSFLSLLSIEPHLFLTLTEWIGWRKLGFLFYFRYYILLGWYTQVIDKEWNEMKQSKQQDCFLLPAEIHTPPLLINSVKSRNRKGKIPEIEWVLCFIV